jgi:hypothetical protein
MGSLFRGGAKHKARLCGPGFQVSFLGIDLYLFSFGGPANHNTCTLGMRTMRLFLMQAATLTEHGAKIRASIGCRQAMPRVFVGFLNPCNRAGEA